LTKRWALQLCDDRGHRRGHRARQTIGVGPAAGPDGDRLGRTLGDLSGVVAPATGLVTALDTGDLGLAFTSGLSVVAAGAKALGNDKGAFSSTAPGVDTLFEFEPETQRTLTAIARGTGATALVTRVIQAATGARPRRPPRSSRRPSRRCTIPRRR
jgi:hypothetical protein